MQSSYYMIRVTPTALVNKLAELRFLRCVQHTGNRTNNATPSASVTDVIKTSNTTVSTVTEPVQIPPTTRHDTTRHDTTRHDTIRYDTTRYDTIRHDTTRYATTRHDTRPRACDEHRNRRPEPEQNPGHQVRPTGGDRVRCPRPHKLDGARLCT